MKQAYASILGGLTAGLAMSLAMVIGRRAGFLHRTLAEDAEDWLDRTVDSRRRIGKAGTTAMEQANHMAAAAAFGFGYFMLRGRAPDLPAWALGMLYGAGLYAVNIAGVAPLIQLTEGERHAPVPVRAQRLGLHLLYGVVAAAMADVLTTEKGRTGVGAHHLSTRGR